jgi:hypothetical protein
VIEGAIARSLTARRMRHLTSLRHVKPVIPGGDEPTQAVAG